MRVGSDTGGTFTDLVATDGSVVKVPSTPGDPGRAVREGMATLVGGVDAVSVLAHGTTVATNAVLEGKLAATALVTNAGFADVIEIARQDRPSLYDPLVDRPRALVERHLRLEVAGRLDASGSELVPLLADDVPPIPDGVEVVAVCLLHADLNPAHEDLVVAELESRGVRAIASHRVCCEFREYERTVTTVIDAGLRPKCGEYLERLASVGDEVLVMTSAGGLTSAQRAADRPASLLLSGPAGGVLAGAAVAVANGFPDAVTFDMGGTSTDVGLVLEGQPAPAAQRTIAGYPVRLPSLDVHTIGAGGGSIARIDAGGALVVGPESAGAVPGPASYGRGGTQPTVTDAHLVAGRIAAGARFGGLLLDRGLAQTALERAGVSAEGVLAVVNAAMEEAVRVMTVARGIDPRGLALVAFGGAGPLHACDLAEALDIPTVLVPARAGVLSAVGILTAPMQVDMVRSWSEPASSAGLAPALEELRRAAAAQAGPGAQVSTSVDCRYGGQSHEITVPTVADFEAEHERRNGYARPGAPVEVVALRAVARIPSPIALSDLPDVERTGGVGPVAIHESDCTVWVPAGWVAESGALGALVLRRVEA